MRCLFLHPQVDDVAGTIVHFDNEIDMVGLEVSSRTLSSVMAKALVAHIAHNASTFRQYRSAELKHGRICMVALGGLIAQHSWKLPAFRLEPSSSQAPTPGRESAASLALITLFVGIIGHNTTDDGREHGDAAQAEAFTKQPPMSRVSAGLISIG